MTQIKTWKEAFDFTWRTKWKRTNSAKTMAINAGHITEAVGLSFPLRKMAKAGFWIELISDFEEEGRSGSTINRIVSAGTTALKHTRLAGLHEIDCPKFNRCKEGEHRLTYFSKEQVEQLSLIARDIYGDTWGHDLADAILVSAYTGVRQGELLKLKADDYDSALNSDQLWIGGKPGRVTKGKNVRNVTLHPKVQPIIKSRLNQDRLFGDDWLNKDQLYRSFTKVRKLAGHSEDYVWHSLRHSFGTWLGEQTHPRQIMALMGHKNIETSLRYVKATDAAVRSAVLAI